MISTNFLKWLKNKRALLALVVLAGLQCLFLVYSLGVLLASVVNFFSPHEQLVFVESATPYYAVREDLNYTAERYKDSILGQFFNTQAPPKGLLDGDKNLAASLDRIVLTGVFVWIGKSFALVRYNDMPFNVENGKEIPNTSITLAKVERTRALFKQAEQEKWVDILPITNSSGSSLGSSAVAAGGEQATDGSQQNQGGIVINPARGTQQEVLVSQERLELEMKNFAQLLNQAQVSPSFENGKSVGYNIRNIAPGSVYEQLGLKNQDLIKSINGNAIDSPEKALELFRLLRNEKTVQLSLVRDGSPLNLTFHIK